MGVGRDAVHGAPPAGPRRPVRRPGCRGWPGARTRPRSRSTGSRRTPTSRARSSTRRPSSGWPSRSRRGASSSRSASAGTRAGGCTCIVCGERRWRAARMAGLPTLTCVIVEAPIDRGRAAGHAARRERPARGPAPDRAGQGLPVAHGPQRLVGPPAGPRAGDRPPERGPGPGACSTCPTRSRSRWSRGRSRRRRPTRSPSSTTRRSRPSSPRASSTRTSAAPRPSRPSDGRAGDEGARQGQGGEQGDVPRLEDGDGQGDGRAPQGVRARGHAGLLRDALARTRGRAVRRRPGRGVKGRGMPDTGGPDPDRGSRSRRSQGGTG